MFPYYDTVSMVHNTRNRLTKAKFQRLYIYEAFDI